MNNLFFFLLFSVFILKDVEQQLGDYEKELKILRVKLDAANSELECMKAQMLCFVCFH